METTNQTPIRYTPERPLRLFEAFAGYGSQALALERVAPAHPGFAYEIAGWSEIEPNAITAHNLLHPEAASLNFGDISKIDWAEVPDFDLFTMSSPCQDFSLAGLRRGGEEGSGTRSSLLWECRRAILAKKPKYILMENVKTLVGKKFYPLFLKWCAELDSYGYSNFWQVLNAKEHGVPQNRERVFMVSVLRSEDEPAPSYTFPSKIPLTRCLADLLDEEVPEKYFISDEQLAYFKRVTADQSHGHALRPLTDDTEEAHAVTVGGQTRVDGNYYAGKTPAATDWEEPKTEADDGDEEPLGGLFG